MKNSVRHMGASAALEIGGAFCGSEASAALFSQKRVAAGSTAGFVLVDSLLNPISFNAEAVQILGYRNGENRGAGFRVGGGAPLIAPQNYFVFVGEGVFLEEHAVREFRAGARAL